jgi:preprotein translocase subunit SecE
MSITQVETVDRRWTRPSWRCGCCCVVGGSAAFYLLGKQGVRGAVGRACWRCWPGRVAVFFTSNLARQLIAFGRDSARETREGGLAYAQGGDADAPAYVFGFVFIMALFLWLTDKTLEWVLYDLDPGLEALMTDAGTRPDAKSRARRQRQCRTALVRCARLFRHGEGGRAQPALSASTAPACRTSSAASWCRSKKWSR